MSISVGNGMTNREDMLNKMMTAMLIDPIVPIASLAIGIS